MLSAEDRRRARMFISHPDLCSVPACIEWITALLDDADKLELNSAYGKGRYPTDAVSAYPPVAAVGAMTPMLPMWRDYDGKCPNGCPMCTPEGNSAVCPDCGETFYALPKHDPLKHHADYCEARTTGDSDD